MSRPWPALPRQASDLEQGKLSRVCTTINSNGEEVSSQWTLSNVQRTRSDIIWSEARDPLVCHLFPFYGTECGSDQTLPPLSISNAKIPDRRPGRHNQSGQCSSVGSGWRVRGDPGISLLLLLLLGSDRRAAAGLTFSPHSEREAAVTTV